MTLYQGKKRKTYFVWVVKKLSGKLFNLLGPRSTPVQGLSVRTNLRIASQKIKLSTKNDTITPELCIHIYIYIYIKKEREIQRERRGHEVW